MFSAFLPRRLWLLLGLAVFGLSGCPAAPAAASPSAPVPAAAPLPWDSGAQGAFVTSLCRDLQGRVWIGTEGQGVWRYDPAAPKDKPYTHFTTQDGLGDNNAYALICDRKGRVWVGTLNHGVSVYNGKAWKIYLPPNGPLGLRVFALAASPVNGDVWIATEAGLTRYSLAHDNWMDYTRGDGLPTDAATALAFDAKGVLYVGTQADGIAIGAPASGYHAWRVVSGPARMPNAPTGTGLQSGLINCLLVARSGAVYAGTTTGLARSADGGKTWHYTRGADWRDKVNGLYHGPKPVETAAPVPLLLEDYVTCLAEDRAGHLLVGHRQQGLEVRDPKTGARLFPGPKDAPAGAFVTALLPRQSPSVLMGDYGNGLVQSALPEAANAPVQASSKAVAVGIAPLPSPAQPPTLAELNRLWKQMVSVAPNPQELTPHVTALADDWLTEGNWLGRYGRYWACFPALFHPIPVDYLWGAGWQPVDYDLTTGANHGPADTLRYWLETRYTTEAHCLELPPTYLHSRVLKGYTTWEVNRRDTSVDDHGETYPMSLDGPHIYATVTVPPGLYFLSLYFFTRQDFMTGRRDYRLSIRAHSGSGLEDVAAFDAQPEWARGRVRQNFGGVWKRFLVRGPVALTVQVNRNNSWNTELDGVMLDLVDEDPAPYFQTVEHWNARETQREKERQRLASQWPLASRRFQPAASEAEAANRLFDALQEKRLTNSTWWATEGRRCYAPLLRWYAAVARQPASGSRTRLFQRQAACYYQIGQYGAWEDLQKAAGQTSARDIEKSLRWDSVTDSYSGLGYEVVTTHLAEKISHKESRSR